MIPYDQAIDQKRRRDLSGLVCNAESQVRLRGLEQFTSITRMQCQVILGFQHGAESSRKCHFCACTDCSGISSEMLGDTFVLLNDLSISRPCQRRKGKGDLLET